MLHIETFLDKSSINGIGLFSKNFIPSNTIVWSFNKDFDKKYSIEYVETLDLINKKFIQTYGWICIKDSNFYRLSVDNERFCNHSLSPNLKTENRWIWR